MILKALSGTLLLAALASPGPAIAQGLPGVFRTEPAQVQLAQATADPRVVALEEQLRALNGTVEELNFQILQLQEQLRKMQEDNEFRFQELEKRSDARTGKGARTTAETAPAVVPPPADGQSVEDVIQQDQSTAGATGEAPKTFGTITFDADGNPIGGGVGNVAAEPTPPPAETPALAANPDGTQVAALPQSSDPEELYKSAYQFILSGDYATAEAGFRDHIARFPDDERAPDSQFWLGEALLGQKKYRDAAEVLLAASKQYPAAKKAPDMLLKLGVSLAGLKQRDVACATFGEVGKRYPNASAALKQRVKQEQARTSC